MQIIPKKPFVKKPTATISMLTSNKRDSKEAIQPRKQKLPRLKKVLELNII